MGNIDAALKYADLGYHVLPLQGVVKGHCTCGDRHCSSAGKHPLPTLVPHGVKDASCDAQQIRDWWTRYPNANIGIRTGAVSNLVVLDIDVRHGGDASLATLRAEHGAIPVTVTVRTGGGHHYWFQHPDGPVENRVNLRPGIDLKGDNGYVVAPPSLHHSGRLYNFDAAGHILKVPVAPMPGWLLDLARRRNEAQLPTTADGDIPEGTRNSTLYGLARSLKIKGLSATAVQAALLEENAARCKPALPATEVEVIVANAFRQPDRTAFGANADDADPALVTDGQATAVLPTPKPEIFAGSIGWAVDLFDPHTEADRVAVAAQLIIAFGNTVGHEPHFFVGETQHFMNEFLAIVGTSSRSRKGDSKAVALSLLRRAVPEWNACIVGGLSSSEGLIFAVRDAVLGRTLDENGEPEVLDEGVSDKRLLVVETEFSNALKQFLRSGNTLSNLLRDVWDSKSPLCTLTRKSPLRATNAHISIIAHTTPEDLHQYLNNTEAANGLGNRFLFVLVRRSKLLPNPGRAPWEDIKTLADYLSETVEFAQKVGEMRRTPAAEALWEQIYPTLTQDYPGLLGSLLARSEAHVARLSALYALLARSADIDVPHLQSALALWAYVEASTRNIFGNRTGNEIADRIRQEMVPGQRLTRKEIRQQIFANHVSAARLADAIKLLAAIGDIRLDHEQETGGRPRVVITRLASAATKKTLATA